jgi:SRSO17 transposase
VWTTNAAAVAACDRVGAAVWCGCIDDLLARVGRHVARPESRIRLESMLLALLSREGPKNCWTLAEQAGEARPWGMQHLLARAVWDTDAVAGELRDFAVEHLGAADAILVVDETGDLKKGRHTVGVQRQYTGTAGRIENAQVGVYLGYATRRGHALIDRELYLPRSWTDDPDRCAAAGVPAGVGFATKPALAQALIERALDAGVPASWVTADEVYGADPRLASTLETRGVGYVLAIAAHRRLPVDAASARTAAQLAADLPRWAWQVRSAGAGAHGPRRYAWAWIELHPRTAAPARRPQPGEQPEQSPPGAWSLLVRRNLRTGELAFYRCYAPTPTTLAQLIDVAGRRWTIEESFQAGKGLAGLDEHQVRRWTPWRRWTLLAMLAHALLAVITAAEREHRPAHAGLIDLTCAEVGRLLTAALATLPARIDALTHAADWSRWRRGHQHRARTCHYARYGVRLS